MYVFRKTFQLIRSIFTLDEGEAIHLKIFLQLEGPFAGSNYNVRAYANFKKLRHKCDSANAVLMWYRKRFPESSKLNSTCRRFYRNISKSPNFIEIATIFSFRRQLVYARVELPIRYRESYVSCTYGYYNLRESSTCNLL